MLLPDSNYRKNWNIGNHIYKGYLEELNASESEKNDDTDF